MAKPSPLIYLNLWHRALAEEIGIAIPIAGCTREYFRNELYACRKLANDPELDKIIMFLPAGSASGEIWLCKKSVELNP